MYISTKDWKNYIQKLSALDEKAGELMQEWIRKNGFGDTKALIDYAYAVATKYGEGSASLAAAMYDAIAEVSGKFIEAAEVAATPAYGEVAKTVNGTLKSSQNPNTLSNAISRLVKRTGADTMLKNAERDRAQFAWVPNGDTCAFCIALASRGWQDMSSKALKDGHAEHIHANCDCTYAVRFDKKSGVAGYDPQKYEDMYYGAEGSTPQERINSLRRMRYAERKDVINAQKRAAYGERLFKNGYEAAASKLRPKFGAYIPDEKTREEIIRRGVTAERPIFTSDLLGRLAEGLPTKDGSYDVVLHGWKNHLEFFGRPIDVETLCAIIAQRGDYKEGTPIRLISCYTGSTSDGVAQYIANKLHVDVEAPNKKGIISKDIFGRYEVYSGSTEGVHDGEMVVFHPQNSKILSDEKGTSRIYY